jgi:hypothetical protein
MRRKSSSRWETWRLLRKTNLMRKPNLTNEAPCSCRTLWYGPAA